MEDGTDQSDHGFASSFRRAVSDGAVSEVARERSRTRVLRQVAEEEATFAGVALDLAERGEVVVARTSAGRTQRGWVTAVGRDFMVLHDGCRPPVVLALGAVTSLRPQPGAPRSDAAGGRPAPLAVGLGALLARLAGERPRVQLLVGSSCDPITGELRAVGADVATVILDGEAGNAAYVRLEGVAEIVLLDGTW